MGRAFPTYYPDSLNMVSQSWVGTEDPFSLQRFFFFLLFIATTKANFKIKAINHNHAYFTILFFVLTFLRTVGIRMYIKLWVLFSPLIRYCIEFSKSLHNPPERWAEDRVGPCALATVTGTLHLREAKARGGAPAPAPPTPTLALSHT